MEDKNHGCGCGSGKPESWGGRLRECPPQRAAPVAPPLFRCVAHPNSLATGVIRRLPEINVPDCAGFSFPCKARPPAHSELCNGGRNAAGEGKDKQAGAFIDRNRLSTQPANHANRNTLVWRLVQRNKEGGRRPDDIRATECRTEMFRVTAKLERAHNPTPTIAPC